MRPEEAASADPDPTATRTVRGAASIVSDYTAVLAGRVGSVLLSFATIVIATRLLGPTGYGVVAYATVLATIVFTLGSAWTSAAVPRFGREALERGERLAAVTAERLILTAPGVAIAAAGVVVAYAADALPDALGLLLVLLALAYGLVLAVSDHVIYVLQALGRMTASALGVVGRQLIVVSALGVLLAAGASVEPWAVVTITVVALALVTAVVAAAVWGDAVWPPALDPVLRKRIALFSLPLVAFTVSQYVMQTVDLLVIGAVLTTAHVGIYAVAYQTYTVLQNVAAASTTVLTPLFVSLRAAGRDDLIAGFAMRTVAQLTLVVSTVVAVVAPVVPLLVVPVFGPSFEAAGRPLVLLLVAFVLLSAASLFAPVILLYEATRPVAVVNVAAAVVNVAGDIVLIGVLNAGLLGAAIATVGAVLVLVAGYAWIVARVTRVRSPWPLLASVPVLVSVTVVLAAPHAAWGALGVLVAVAVAGSFVASGSLFSREDVDLARQLDLPPRAKRVLVRAIELAARA